MDLPTCCPGELTIISLHANQLGIWCSINGLSFSTTSVLHCYHFNTTSTATKSMFVGRHSLALIDLTFFWLFAPKSGSSKLLHQTRDVSTVESCFRTTQLFGNPLFFSSFCVLSLGNRLPFKIEREDVLSFSKDRQPNQRRCLEGAQGDGEMLHIRRMPKIDVERTDRRSLG